MRLTVEIWRHAGQPDVIHIAHERFHAQVRDQPSSSGGDPALYRSLSALLDESGEPASGRRQRGAGRRARRASEPSDGDSQG